MKQSFKDLKTKAKRTFEYRVEGPVLSFNEAVVAAMKAQELTRRDLAARVGCSAPFITRVLRGHPNLTVATMVKIADALGCEVSISLSEAPAHSHAHRNGHLIGNGSVRPKHVNSR